MFYRKKHFFFTRHVYVNHPKISDAAHWRLTVKGHFMHVMNQGDFTDPLIYHLCPTAGYPLTVNTLDRIIK